ncbi:MAG: hypothetical protein RJA22_1797 [Verrucomicrobiota bacterium]
MIRAVSSAAILTDNSLPSAASRRTSSAARWLFYFSLALLLLVLAGSVHLYLEGSNGLHRVTANQSLLTDEAKAVVVREMESWVRQVSLATAAGGLSLLIVLAMGALGWRRIWVQRLDARSLELDEARRRHQETLTELQRQTVERRRQEQHLAQVQAEIEQRVVERTATLHAGQAQLQKELNERRQAERAMAQQAKELERSKELLEMHVQMRTQESQKLKLRYESILNAAGEGIYGLDAQGRTTFVNPAAAKITGWRVEELVGKLEDEVFRHVADDEPGDPAAPEASADPLFRRRDGSVFPVEYVRTDLCEGSRVVGAVVIFKDITERKRAEENLSRKAAELARSNAELEQFAYVASHDLQEPLRKIQAFGDRLKARCDAANLQEGRDYLERMQGAAARMQVLIKDLLTFSRVMSSSQPFTQVDCGGVVRDVLSDLEVRIENTKAVVNVSPLPTIDADPLQMRQLFQNLISNALKFQPPGQAPVIDISARLLPDPVAGPGSPEGAGHCAITVRDNGIGFDQKYMEKIFAVFQRLHGREEYEGTGVGLAVCRRITDRHGGSITACSELGRGAAFQVTLPVRHASQTLAP